MTSSPARHQEKRFVHAVNVTMLVLAIVVLYWRVFFLGQTIIDVNTLNNQLPWGYNSSAVENYPYNRRDPTDMYITREYFIVASYRNGELPLWNPYTMCGHPIYADGVTRIFSPSLLFYTFLDLPLGYSIARLVELMLGAVFMYLFLLAIGVSPRGALFGSLVFELSAHSLFHVTGLGWWGGLMWLPLIFLFVDRAITKNSYKQAIFAGLCLAAQWYFAYMPNQIYYVGAILLYYLVFGLRVKKVPAASHLTLKRILVMLLVTVTIGLLLAATQWLPVMELLGYSNRKIVPTESSYIYLPPWYLLTLVSPTFFGTAYDPTMINLFAAINVSHDHSLYLGIAALLPLGFLFYSLKKKGNENHLVVASTGNPEVHKDAIHHQRIVFFSFLLILALFIVMAAPLYVHITRFVPVLQTIRVIVRAGVLFIFAAAVLAGCGMDKLLEAKQENLRRFAQLSKRFLFASLIFAVIGILLSYVLKYADVANTSVEYVAGSGWRAYVQSVLTALTSQFAPPQIPVIVPLLLILIGYFLLHSYASGKLTGKTFYVALIIFLIGDLYFNSRQFDKTHDAARVFPKTEITETLHSLPPGRLLVTPSGIETNRRSDMQDEKIIAPPNTLLAYQIPTITGKDQLFPKSYREFCALIEPQNRLSHVVFEKAASPYFDLLNARYVMTYADAPQPDNCQLIQRAEGVSLYENKAALPRAFFVAQEIHPTTSESVLTILSKPDFDVKTMAAIDNSATPPASLSIANAQATITKAENNQVVIKTENEGDGLLVLSDNYYSGWEATIDGNPVHILRANHTMRAVRVPAGGHVVSFRFAPKVFRASMIISVASAFAVLLALIWLRQKRQT